ncbi:MAG: T9SS type A sorting domain-containing protein [Prolixibacteraceae bacterium]|nr:T9SS type A sorting domain-containing protein [Prolixibacteraceae bacterium]
MKKNTLIMLFLFAIGHLQAQDYKISFAGTGASATVGTVKVENLTQNKSAILNGSEVLHLVSTSTGVEPLLDVERTIRIYPNPMTDVSQIDFGAIATGLSTIELYDMSGKRIGISQKILPIGTHFFQICGLGSGIFTIKVNSQAYNYTGKLVSNRTAKTDAKISYLGTNSISIEAKRLKSAITEKLMQYNLGDRLKITGKSGNYSTIVMEVPTQDKIISFNFVACSDVDGNNYPVVQIGTQVWMAENLKSTKYNDGTAIPNVSDPSAWAALITPGYCNFNNIASTETIPTFGRLYNWFAINTEKLAPIGWHVPTVEQWETFINYLGGITVAGSKMKETGTNNWAAPNTGAIDEKGFTALPGGGRYQYTAEFKSLGTIAGFWSSTTTAYYEPNKARVCFLYFDSNRIDVGSYYKQNGYSVRCIKD